MKLSDAMRRALIAMGAGGYAEYKPCGRCYIANDDDDGAPIAPRTIKALLDRGLVELDEYTGPDDVYTTGSGEMEIAILEEDARYEA